MPRTRVASEVVEFGAPFLRLADAAWRRMHWWIVTMVILYALSGITIVRSDEVAVVLRWGRLVRTTAGARQHGPGLLIAFPRPVDRIVRVPVTRVYEVPVSTLSGTEAGSNAQTLDPLTGYALTGDQNIVHVDMVARYRIRDPVEWAFYGPTPAAALRAEVTAAMVRSLGEMGVDRVLSDGRKALIAAATARAQAGLDAARSGLELSSLEVTRLEPPAALAADFSAVQSAFIDAQTQRNDAQAYAAQQVPAAQAEADSAVQTARGDAASMLAAAHGEADAFRALAMEARTGPAVLRERLYRDAVERAIAAAGQVRWIPPPSGSRYSGLRITVAPAAAAATGSGTGETRTPTSPAAPAAADEEDEP